MPGAAFPPTLCENISHSHCRKQNSSSVLTPLLWSYPETASVRMLGTSDRETERFRNCPTVSVSRVSELRLRVAGVGSNGRMDLGQTNSDVTTVRLACSEGFPHLCHNPQGVSDVSETLSCDYFNKHLHRMRQTLLMCFTHINFFNPYNNPVR